MPAALNSPEKIPHNELSIPVFSLTETYIFETVRYSTLCMIFIIKLNIHNRAKGLEYSFHLHFYRRPDGEGAKG